MGFLMDGLDSEAYDRTYTDRQLVKRILGYFRPQSRKMLIVALAILLTALLDTALPIFISFSIDTLGENTSTTNFILLSIGLSLIAGISWVFNAVRQQLASQAVGDVVLKLRDDAFDAVLQRDLSFYDTFQSGKIVSRVTSDTQAFSQVMALTMELISRILLVVLLIGEAGGTAMRVDTVLRIVAILLLPSAARSVAINSRQTTVISVGMKHHTLVWNSHTFTQGRKEPVASSIVEKEVIGTMGPNTSSAKRGMSGVTPVTTVGLKNSPS